MHLPISLSVTVTVAIPLSISFSVTISISLSVTFSPSTVTVAIASTRPVQPHRVASMWDWSYNKSLQRHMGPGVQCQRHFGVEIHHDK